MHLLGSTAPNKATASSDVDVWVELDPFTPFATVHLKQELERIERKASTRRYGRRRGCWCPICSSR